jgi:hypothetical protein
MSNSSKIYDTIVLSNNYVESENDTFGVLLQDSIRYEKFKKFAVYKGEKYIGNYQCSAKSVMSYHEINETFCKLIFGNIKEASKMSLNSIIKKGKFTEKSMFCFVVLFKISYNPNYEYENRNYV